MSQLVISSRSIAGTVILYNSPVEIIYNINTYINQVEKLYVVDNSTEYNIELISALKKYPNVCYYSLNGNVGIATALNWAADQAIADGYTVLLTMDDDTRTPNLMISMMTDFWNSYSMPIGILSGVHQTNPDLINTKLNKRYYRTLPYTLTSGNMLNLVAYKEVGRFWDDLFIDHVDHEYGLRLNANGYQVVELTNIHLEHKLGYRQEIKFGKYIIKKYGTHSPIRLYYFARNGLHVARIYLMSHPFFAWTVVKEVIKRLIKASFLDKNPRIRVKMLLLGIRDGFNGQLGKYIE